SVPFVQFIGDYPEEAAAAATGDAAVPESVDKTAARLEPVPQIADGRGGRVISNPVETAQDNSQAAKGDRVAWDGAVIDRDRLAYGVDTTPTMRRPSHERFLAPARTAE